METKVLGLSWAIFPAEPATTHTPAVPQYVKFFADISVYDDEIEGLASPHRIEIGLLTKEVKDITISAWDSQMRARLPEFLRSVAQSLEAKA